LRVVVDQQGHPTAAPDLADAIAAILVRVRESGWREDYRGVFHAVADGHTTWHAFAEAIFAAARPFGGPSPVVHAIATADYPTKARRPVDGRLDTTKLRATFGVALRPWQDGLARVIHALYAPG
jgi:dTDP-4-dehydrorhamnose reductase